MSSRHHPHRRNFERRCRVLAVLGRVPPLVSVHTPGTLVAAKVTLDYLVIDHVDRVPAEN